MGGRSGGLRHIGGGAERGGNYTGKISNIGSLKEIPDAEVYRLTSNAISRYHSVLGVRQTNVKLADLEGAYGVHVSRGGQSEGVFLDRQTFSQSRAQIESQKREAYRARVSTATNKPIAHTITHELAHATWNAHLTGANQVAAGREIRALYREWRADRQGGMRSSAYGSYAGTNVS